MDAAAIILARGGSKGIPGKNLTRIGDHSLLGWAIRSCHQAELVSAIYVSTEDGGIAKEAETYGASVIWRPAELATDTACGVEALYHAACHVADRHDIIADVECTCFPSYGANIDATIRAIEEYHADSATTVKQECVFLWAERPDGFAYPLFREWRNRQEMPPEFKLTGECFAARREAFMRTKQILTGGLVLVKVTQNQVDIDEPFDLEIAKFLYERM